jgi:hypothetical protein
LPAFDPDTNLSVTPAIGWPLSELFTTPGTLVAETSPFIRLWHLSVTRPRQEDGTHLASSLAHRSVSPSAIWSAVPWGFVSEFESEGASEGSVVHPSAFSSATWSAVPWGFVSEFESEGASEGSVVHPSAFSSAT